MYKLNTEIPATRSPSTRRPGLFRLLLTALAMPLWVASAAELVSQDSPQLAQGANLRIMSYNILSEEWNDKTPVDGRKESIAWTILHFSPDVVGLQEVSDNWYAVLPDLIASDYEMVRPKNARGQTNYSGMAYNKKKVRLLDSGTENFKAGNSTKMRLVTWGHYERLDNRKKFVVMNTHWCIKKENRLAEAQEMAEIFAAKRKQYNCPVITVGDFNASQKSEEYQDYATRTGLKNARVDAQKVNRNYRTSHVLGKKPRPDRLEDSIDQIFFTDELTCLFYNVLIDRVILDASDHTPIYADFQMK